MSIVGVTIDYGPYGFMDRYDPNFICNGSDDSGRYSYKQQPSICKWNCGKLAEALTPVLPLERSRSILNKFDQEYERVYLNKMRLKVFSNAFTFKLNENVVFLVLVRSPSKTIGYRYVTKKFFV